MNFSVTEGQVTIGKLFDLRFIFLGRILSCGINVFDVTRCTTYNRKKSNFFHEFGYLSVGFKVCISWLLLDDVCS